MLYHDDLDKYPFNWSLDGKYLAYETIANNHFDIWVMPMVGDRKPYAFISGEVRHPLSGVFAGWKMDGFHIVRGRA